MASRLRGRSTVACLLFASMAIAAPRAAALPPAAGDLLAASADPPDAAVPSAEPDSAFASTPIVISGLAARVEPRARPAALVPLYVSFAALQMLDAGSTYAALHRGAREANPWTAGASDSPAAFLAIKAAGSAAVFIASERLWKKHRAASVFMMLGLNAAYAAVAVHNYHIAAGR